RFALTIEEPRSSLPERDITSTVPRASSASGPCAPDVKSAAKKQPPRASVAAFVWRCGRNHGSARTRRTDLPDFRTVAQHMFRRVVGLDSGSAGGVYAHEQHGEAH